MKQIELLAPCGSLEKAKVAFKYGADAIYCGTGELSLRARSGIDNEELYKIIEYAHSINKKVFVTLNIYALDELYEKLEDQIKKLKELKVDAIIASDGGVVNLIKKVAPEIPIHISTQANTLSYHSAKFWYDNGASRVILSREMNKEDIEKVIKNIPKELETEIFIHGAICWAYSGRCYLSDFMTGRNANSGDCAQNCRWAYNMYLEEKQNKGQYMPIEETNEGTYILSSKDLCLIKNIPEIIDMGVTSLKIEGRLKSEYYIGSVVNVYRTAIDDYLKKPNDFNGEKYYKELEKTKTRELTDFFFNNKDNKDYQELKGRQYNDIYEFGGLVLKYDKEKTLIKIGNRLEVGDIMEIIIPNQIENKTFVINELWDSETNERIDFVNPGKFGQTVLMKLPIKCEENYIIRKKKKEIK